MILKPVENIFTLYFPIVGEMNSDVLYLRSIRSSDSTPEHPLKYHQLLWRWTPSYSRHRLRHRHLAGYLEKQARSRQLKGIDLVNGGV